MSKIIEEFENYIFNEDDCEIASIFLSLKDNELNELIIYELNKVKDDNTIIVDGYKINETTKREKDLEINNFKASFFNKTSFNVDFVNDIVSYIKNKIKASSVFATIYFDEYFFVDITYMNLNFINKIRLDYELKEIENKQINTKEIFRFT
ncbi:MAG: hypothetical protein PHT94_04680 [Candidatus Nanoarchaeia archaeon]|nr:hypothetical protein [Candidatus Nanoarchaeia archaeon]